MLNAIFVFAEVSQDGPLLDITELNAADKSPCDPSSRVPGRGARPAVPLPAVPQERVCDYCFDVKRTIV